MTDIAKIQQVLKERGFDVGEIDGINGPKTKAALMDFQKANNLTPDGLFGPKTSDVMFPTQPMNLDANTIKNISAVVYGENRGSGDEAYRHTASSIFNRVGKNEWANKDINTILNEGYYAIRDSRSGKNKGYSEAINHQFPDLQSENEYKKIHAIVASMNSGKIKPYDTQFYFDGTEIKNMKDKKSFDFEKVVKTGEFDGYRSGKKVKFSTFKYK